jgi:hypothetical protein
LRVRFGPEPDPAAWNRFEGLLESLLTVEFRGQLGSVELDRKNMPSLAGSLDVASASQSSEPSATVPR